MKGIAQQENELTWEGVRLLTLILKKPFLSPHQDSQLDFHLQPLSIQCRSQGHSEVGDGVRVIGDSTGA